MGIFNLSSRFGVSSKRLQEAVDAVGDNAAAVERYLRQKGLRLAGPVCLKRP